MAPKVDGRTILDHLGRGDSFFARFVDISTRELFRTLVVQSREGHPATFEYRGDTSSARRWLQMEIESPDGKIVEFRARELRSEPRPSISGGPGEAQPQPLRLCSWCQKVAVPPDSWLPVEVAMELLGTLSGDALPQVSHTICPKCQAKTLRESREGRAVHVTKT